MPSAVLSSDGGGGGQEAPGSETGTGGRLIILHQRESTDATPGDPPDPYTNGAYVTDFGDWSEDFGDSTGTGTDWMAIGGTSLDSDGAVVNRSWQVQSAIEVQFAEVVQDNDTYTATSTSDSRFVRRRSSDGSWGPWLPLSNTDWVPVLTDRPAYADTGQNAVHELDDFDATYFTEMRVSAWTYGHYSMGYQNLGIRGEKTFTRYGNIWTDQALATTDGSLGSYGFRLEFRVGLSGIQQLSSDAEIVLQNNVAGGTDDPHERVSWRMDIIRGTNGNHFNRVLVRPAGGNALVLYSVEMR